MVILVVFNSFNVVKNLKKPDPVVRQKRPFYTTFDDTKKLLYFKDLDFKFSEASPGKNV